MISRFMPLLVSYYRIMFVIFTYVLMQGVGWLTVGRAQPRSTPPSTRECSPRQLGKGAVATGSTLKPLLSDQEDCGGKDAGNGDSERHMWGHLVKRKTKRGRGRS